MKTKSKLFFACLAAFSVSCDDILEKDITNDNITISYPMDNQEVESNVVNFQWGALDGADDYRIQVFAENQSMVLDSLVSTNYFTYAMNPGMYQWRVRGENFAYQTAYTFPVTFSLVTTEDLTNQQVQLVSPSDGFYSQNMTPFFSWNNVAAAQHYSFQLVNITSGNMIIYEADEEESTTLSLSSGIIIQDGQYQWKVKAVNQDNDTQTPYASRTFFIDTSAPNQPQNTQPANNTTVSAGQMITFQWSVPQDSGTIFSPLTHTFQIATDETFSNILASNNQNITTYQYSVENAGTVYWRVRSTDAAGNIGNFGTSFKITVLD